MAEPSSVEGVTIRDQVHKVLDERILSLSKSIKFSKITAHITNQV